VLYFLNLTGLLLPAGSLSFYLRLGVVAFFSIWGALAWRPKGLGFWMLLAFPAVYIGFYALGHPYMKFWYVAPFTTGSALLFFYGLWQSSQRLRVGAPVLVLALLAIVAAELRWVYFIDGTVLDQYTRRIAIYQKVVDDLKARYPVTAETTMLTHEIGAFGFEWPGRVYDVVGLVNPEQAKLGYTQVAGHTQFGVVTRAWIDL
ncbi:MAG: hypothetical protein KDK78_03340, partial [Chlamydiia bacterium]|nr:hypothetical protein [Chlamydiia bacterium]